jgi:hypothetical protein
MPPLKKKDLEVSQTKKGECNARAQKIVLELIDGIENEKQFLERVRLSIDLVINCIFCLVFIKIEFYKL